MPIRKEAIHFLRENLGDQETNEILRLAKKQDSLEAKGRRTIDIAFEKINERVVESLSSWQEPDEKMIYEEILEALVFQSFRVTEEAIRSVKNPVKKTKADLAKPPKGRMPRTLKGLMELWDEWRARTYIPPREREFAKRVKTEYLKKIRSVWEKESYAFRTGKTTKDDVIQKVQEASKSSHARAKLIVETETTRYYNSTRKAIYDLSNDVTHYLFIAIRDQRTTKWCKTRDGLVYEKGSDFLKRETPPCHWNCRSEIVPLTPMNPSHLKLIHDKSIQRGNRKPEPLPKGWNAA